MRLPLRLPRCLPSRFLPSAVLRRLVPLLLLALPVLARPALAQVDGPMQYFKRGQLWNAYGYAKTGAPFNNWRRIDIGMDWPGYDPEFVQADVGGAASHLLTGGLWFSSKDSKGRVIALDDFAMYATSTTAESDAKYRVSQHRKPYGADGNAFLKANPLEAEDVLLSTWARNPNWTPQYAGDRQSPIRVRREVRQWGGYEREQNYILVQYTIKNTGDSTLYDAVAMGTWAFAMNDRAHRILFPQLSSGARNTRFFYNPGVRTLTGWAVDTPDTPERNEAYSWYAGFGPNGQLPGGGEFLAPGYVGIRLLQSTRTKTGLTNAPTFYAWMPADPNQDQQGPLVGQTGLDQQYAILRDPRLARNATNNPGASIFGKNRMWSLFSFGPWDIAAGDSVTVAYAETIGGASYDEATRLRLEDAGTIGSRGLAALNTNAARAQFAFDHRYNVPDPPPAPPVAIALFADPADPSRIGNRVTWPATFDQHADPDYAGAEARDLAGYRLYRSDYLPIGPWKLVRDVPRGTSQSAGAYAVTDTTVRIGGAYYYALTAYDTGHATWPVDPAAVFPETGSNRVPVLESSLFANRTQTPFSTTIPKADDLSDVLVVPNPFVQRSSTTPGLEDQIQFVNVPSPCTIRIYTMRGTLVATIPHTEASGIARWNQQTDGELFVESGVYLYTVTTPEGRRTSGKFAIVR